VEGKNKGFRYILEEEKVVEYLKLSIEQMLLWLEEIDAFTRLVLSEKEIAVREGLRAGSL
jgi:hypothetical protein